jgi:hypothetical protein
MAGVVEPKLTGKPEEAVALTVIGAAPKVTLLSDPNVMICHAADTEKLCVTDVPAGKVELPGWLAVIEHVPTARMVTVVPDTVQTVGVVELKVIGSPELAVALMEKGAFPMVALFNGPNAMVWSSGETDAESVVV